MQVDQDKHPCEGCEAPVLYRSLRECPHLGRDMAIEGCNRMYGLTEAQAWAYITEEWEDEELQQRYAAERARSAKYRQAEQEGGER